MKIKDDKEKKTQVRTKGDVIDEIAVILKLDRSLSFFATIKRWNKSWLEDLCDILKAKNILLLPEVTKEKEWSLCEKCGHHKKTEFGMSWCDASRNRIDDYEHEKFPGESIPTFECRDNTFENLPEMSVKNECTQYEEVK